MATPQLLRNEQGEKSTKHIEMKIYLKDQTSEGLKHKQNKKHFGYRSLKQVLGGMRKDGMWESQGEREGKQVDEKLTIPIFEQDKM